MAAKQKGDAAGMQQALAEKEELLKKSASVTRPRRSSATGRSSRSTPPIRAWTRCSTSSATTCGTTTRRRTPSAIYKLLVQRYPQSKYVADAYLAFGEYYFNNSKGQRPELMKALAAYKKSASFPENKVYLYALYKEGWCYYNLADFPQALEMFKSVILYADIASSVSSGQQAPARQGCARATTCSPTAATATPSPPKDDFQKVGGADNWWAMLKGLAGLYYDDGNDKASVLVYRQLIRERPLSPEAPFFQGAHRRCRDARRHQEDHRRAGAVAGADPPGRREAAGSPSPTPTRRCCSTRAISPNARSRTWR